MRSFDLPRIATRGYVEEPRPHDEYRDDGERDDDDRLEEAFDEFLDVGEFKGVLEALPRNTAVFRFCRKERKCCAPYKECKSYAYGPQTEN